MVTIVFTDLVGSVRIGDVEGDLHLSTRLERYSLAVRDSASSHGGKVIKFLGDGFMLAFESADNALRSMTELGAWARSAGLPHRARVHIGEPLSIGGDYIGQDVVIYATRRGPSSAGSWTLSILA